jgi:hypothetical protein
MAVQPRSCARSTIALITAALFKAVSIDRTVRGIRCAAVTRQVDADDSNPIAQRRKERSRRSSAKTRSVEKENRALMIGHGVTMPPFTFNVSPET